MFAKNQYQLLDFGRGRRLERFGEVILDRPCPAAEHEKIAKASLWKTADARFEETKGERGVWRDSNPIPDKWRISHKNAVFELKRTPFGHIGLFAEQADNWEWIAEQVRNYDGASQGGSEPDALRMKVLNLFAYTGGSTLAAAAAGAEVVHIDAAKNVTGWARTNAELSGLGQAPIRWIAEDALKFVERELRRGNGYDAVILDPPSYGHGPGGQAWQLSAHLPELLRGCAELTNATGRFILLTCHTAGFGPQQLVDLLCEAIGDRAPEQIEAGEMTITAADGRELPSGVTVRCTM